MKKKKRDDFTSIGVHHDTKKQYKKFAAERNRDLKDIAAAGIRALISLPREVQDAHLEGRRVDSMSAR